MPPCWPSWHPLELLLAILGVSLAARRSLGTPDPPRHQFSMISSLRNSEISRHEICSIVRATASAGGRVVILWGDIVLLHLLTPSQATCQTAPDQPPSELLGPGHRRRQHHQFPAVFFLGFEKITVMWSKFSVNQNPIFYDTNGTTPT